MLVCALSFPSGAALHAIKGFDKDLAAHGVPELYSADGLEALRALVREEIANVEAESARETGNDRERLRRIADAARGVLERRAASTQNDPHAASSEFAALQSLLYSLRSELSGERHSNFFVGVGRVLKNRSLKVPYLSATDRVQPLTADEAADEAANLVDPHTGTEYSNPAQLAELTPEQVARLDVRRDDYLWYDDSTLRALKERYGTAWKALESRTEARVSEAIHAPYSLSTARRILLFRGIRSSATSPKVDADDLYGQQWRIKWGDEVQTEPLANHLYLELGGKFTDLVYANKGGARDLVLVLGDAASSGDQEECETIATYEALKHCLLKSKYKFDISAHVVSHGVISESMAREEPFASASSPTSPLIGREFVTFNESLVEFQSNGQGAQAFGAGSMSSGDAEFNRAKRGLAIFTHWIHNKDAKDLNSKSVIEIAESAYLEYMHDMGASLGSIKTSGSPNLLKVGDDYVSRSSRSVTLKSHMLYEPRAFGKVTYSDAVWMARKVCALSLEDIQAAIASTRWPDFQQDVMATRLIARRNGIARAFDVSEAISFDAPPTIVSLRTAADRRAAVARYDLAIATNGDADRALALLEESMHAAGIAMTDGSADFEDRPNDWKTKSDGPSEVSVLETTDCKKSVLVALLERTIHPAGLARRLSRRSDDKPLKACQPTRQSLDLPK